jgi:hypothetical protein
MGSLSPSRARLGPVVLGLALQWGIASVHGDAHAGEATRYRLRGEVGAEYDSNVHRSETIDGVADPPIAASPAARVVVSGDLSDVISDGQTIALGAMAAAKLFATAAARAEDLAVAQTSGAWRLRLGERTAVGLQAVYYEAFQRSTSDAALAIDRRDFRSLTPALRLARRLGERAEIAASGGYRLFVFKPDFDSNFQAPTGSLDLRWGRESADGGADWEAAAGATVELRTFEGRALVSPCASATSNSGAACLPYPGASARRDNFLMGHLEVTRTGRVLIGAGYALHWNSSNSYGETVTRHFATLHFAAALPLGLYLAARGELLIARYLHPVFVGQSAAQGLTYLSVDDENRSSVRVDVSRALTDRLQLLARYTFYANEIGASGAAGHFRRQTALLSLSFTVGD